MKAKIINKSSKYFNKIVEVKHLNFKYVFGFLADLREKTIVPFEDVEFVFEYDWEKTIVKYRGLLNISLPPSSSFKFYVALCYAIEQHFGGEIKSIDVALDINEKARKKYWYKKAQLIINNSHPIFIKMSGREYTDLYDINIEDVDINSFANLCRDGIAKLKENIRKNMEILSLYEDILYGMENPGKNQMDYMAIEGI